MRLEGRAQGLELLLAAPGVVEEMGCQPHQHGVRAGGVHMAEVGQGGVLQEQQGPQPVSLHFEGVTVSLCHCVTVSLCHCVTMSPSGGRPALCPPVDGK